MPITVLVRYLELVADACLCAASQSGSGDGRRRTLRRDRSRAGRLVGRRGRRHRGRLRQLAAKVSELRIFDDAAGKMNLAIRDVGGAMLVVSQFTLLGDCRKGRRPSFVARAPPDVAEALYETFVAAVGGLGISVATGRFRQHMLVVSPTTAR